MPFDATPSIWAPLVTIYLPTKNRLPLLSRAVDSALAQDYSNIELIIVDDGSSDGTQSYLNEISMADSRVTYLSNAHSMGACASRNKALQIASGDFVTGLDDDDYLSTSHISSFVELWPHRKKDVALLFPNAFIKKDCGNEVAFKRRNLVKKPSLLRGNFIGNQAFTTIETLKDAGVFDEKFPAWQDLDLWYRILDKGMKAQNTGRFTYTFDESHEYARISTSDMSTILDAFSLFSEKHQLTKAEKSILFMQVSRYYGDLPHFKSIAKSFCYAPTFSDSIYNTRLLAQVIKRGLRL